MQLARFEDDRFRWLDKMTNEKGGASIEEATKAFGVSRKATITWICRWQNYYNGFRDIVQHFITKVPGNPSLYRTGPDWWGERYNQGMGEAWHDELDVEGINSLHVSLGFVKTRTDSVTGKRTLKGTSSRSIRLKWIESNKGVSSLQFAKEFDMTPHNASTLLSNWKRAGLVESEDHLWKLKGQELDKTAMVQKVVGYYDEDGRRKSRLEWQPVERENDKSVQVHE